MYHAKGNKEGPGLHQATPIQKGNHKATTSTVKIMQEFKRNMQVARGKYSLNKLTAPNCEKNYLFDYLPRLLLKIYVGIKPENFPKSKIFREISKVRLPDGVLFLCHW